MPVEEEMMVELIIKGKDPTADKLADYLSQRVEIDDALREAVNKPNKTIEGVVNYVKNQVLETIKQEDRKGTVMRMIEDEEVYNWAVHYILEDSLDFEKKHEPEKPENGSYYEKWKQEHEKKKQEWEVTKPATVKVGSNPQLLFDF